MNELMEKVEDLLADDAIDDLALFVTENFPVAELPLKHTFVGGVYVREMFVKKGVLMVGKVHLTEDPFTLMSGSMRVFTPEDGVVTLTAPLMGITKAGIKKVGYVLEDSHWVNYHALTEAENQAIENGVSEAELVEMVESRILEDDEPAPGRDGKTVYEIYQTKLKERLSCQQPSQVS